MSAAQRALSAFTDSQNEFQNGIEKQLENGLENGTLYSPKYQGIRSSLSEFVRYALDISCFLWLPLIPYARFGA